ncbi:MAG: aminoglycoside adenylyltransferase domain-containing protein [Acutalibacteraceae bacterium]
MPEAVFGSRCSGVETFDLCAYAPRCLPSNLLTLVRVLSYKVEKTILSKYDAGLWALEWRPTASVRSCAPRCGHGTTAKRCPIVRRTS